MPLAVVTGCAGFIGSHLVERLLRSGYTVRGIDRRSPAGGDPEARFNLAGALGHPGFELHVGDLLELDLPPILAGADYILHLAARPGVRGGWGDDFDGYVRDNFLATQRLLRACTGTGVRRLVLASTSAVYGAARPPQRERGPTRPLSPYGVTKLAAEQLVRMYGRQHGLPWTILRYFTVYGPRQRPDMAFRRMLADARAGRPVRVYGDGSQVRDFTYVDDVVAATVLAMRQPQAAGKTLNVAGGSPVSLREALAVLGEVIGRPPRVVHVPPTTGEMPVTRADMTRTRECLGWQPRVGLAEGLSRQWTWLQRRLLQEGLLPDWEEDPESRRLGRAGREDPSSVRTGWEEPGWVGPGWEDGRSVGGGWEEPGAAGTGWGEGEGQEHG
ncbi:MAG: NAD-dependent epimerase/dehydratase family protein [Bacillota bacterium]